jgi:methylthioxylose transferase
VRRAVVRLLTLDWMALDLVTRASDYRGRLPHTAWLAIGAWGCFLVVIHMWGTALNSRSSTHVLAPPLYGHFDLRLSWRVLPALVVAATVIAFASRVTRAAPWRTLLVATMGGAVTWAVALAIINGFDALSAPLESPHDYIANLPMISSVGDFLSNYTRDLASYSVHVEGHPPGALLFFWSLDSIGVAGPTAAALVLILAGASAAPAALLATKWISDENTARRAAPWLAISPAAIWIATSADALFMAVGAWGTTAMVFAMTTTGRRSAASALLGGSTLGAGLFLSYGLVPLLAVAAVVAVALKRVLPIVLGALGGLAVMASFALAGFWWFDGLASTTDLYHLGIARLRPQSYFVVANLAAFSLVLGPAVIVALGYLRDARLWLLVGGALAGVLMADLSGMSKGEVERIWLPFVPWITVAAAAIPRNLGRPLLTGQAAIGLLIGVGVRTPW